MVSKMRTRENISKSLGYANEDDTWDSTVALATLDVLLDIRDMLEKINGDVLYQRHD
jgi:hypothetical protein